MKQQGVMIRNEIFRGIRHLISENYAEAAVIFASREIGEKTAYFETKMKEYYATHEALLLDPKARAAHFTKITRLSQTNFKIEQTLCDPENHNDWILVLEAKVPLENPVPVFNFLGLE
jgi:hypothetical protein